ncbi:Lrp/AsnC family transcriptional regulator [Pacificibacter marinus]|uniref:Leucine-responsive regulatory protein n=1 Tax=Pacificibacter marinus TaxID=658057 RepID=A0A1Y5RE92_9RHOB|nr:Lrp/AsnC ligand binding domain-containing protein [Pacificibacter marinus]SEK23802.1 transcriptional regulator, AsnC family [Pacificibacter marinus]SLN14224.1 Leucine-responsive regulatory protein [Pacificibacter marinus]
MSRDLDRIDLRILEELETNGRLSIVELAGRVNLTNTPCSERVRRLERAGHITGYRAILDMDKLGFSHLTVMQVSLAATAGNNSLDDFNDAVRRIPEVESCLMIAGSFDYLLTVRTRDIAQFRRVLGDKINKLPGILQTNSFAVMEVVKESGEFKLATQIE